MAWTTPRTWSTTELVTAAFLNTHVRDNLNAVVELNTTDWTTWSPSYANLTIGNGTVVARYQQVVGIVTARYELTWGSTTSLSGSPTVSLPVTASSSGYTAARGDIGWCRCHDTGTNGFLGNVEFASTTTCRPMVATASGTYSTVTALSSTVPMTWTTSDVLQFEIVYEAA